MYFSPVDNCILLCPPPAHIQTACLEFLSFPISSFSLQSLLLSLSFLHFADRRARCVCTMLPCDCTMVIYLLSHFVTREIGSLFLQYMADLRYASMKKPTVGGHNLPSFLSCLFWFGWN